MENLRIIREKRNINQQKIAVELEISQESISKYENGNAFPSREILIKLADYLNCSIDYLLCQSFVYNVPIDNIPIILDVFRASVLSVQIISVLPNVDG